MSNMIDRVNRLQVYNQLFKKPYMNAYELAKELNISYEDVELYIASLRKMYKDGEIEKYVCNSTDGYYLKDDDDNSKDVIDYDSMISNYNVIDLKNPIDKKFEKDHINTINNNKSDDNSDNTLTLDLKKQLDNNIKLLKINVVDEDNSPTFSLTVSLS